MVGRALLLRAEPGFSLPAFERFAPPPPPALVAARLDAGSGPGDIVLDMFGRGGWIARAAIDRQRKAVSLETTPLDRLLAEIVLRPPDLRHLDAAVQALAASARRDFEPQGVDRRSIREPLRDLRPTGDPGRGQLGCRAR